MIIRTKPWITVDDFAPRHISIVLQFVIWPSVKCAEGQHITSIMSMWANYNLDSDNNYSGREALGLKMGSVCFCCFDVVCLLFVVCCLFLLLFVSFVVCFFCCLFLLGRIADFALWTLNGSRPDDTFFAVDDHVWSTLRSWRTRCRQAMCALLTYLGFIICLMGRSYYLQTHTPAALDPH